MRPVTKKAAMSKKTSIPTSDLPDSARALALAGSIFELAREAGALALRCRNQSLKIGQKSDGSPSTAADSILEDFICQKLAELTPDIPVVAEERVSRGEVPDIAGRSFWLVDPLDGTKDFIAGEPEFAVVIALVVENTPALGVIHMPALEESYIGLVGHGATYVRGTQAEEIAARIAPVEGLVVVSSRRHGNAPELENFLEDMNVTTHMQASSALKFGLIAGGQADLYPRFGQVMAWDVAAGHALLLAAGGRIATATGQPLDYRTGNFRIPNFIARGKLNG